MTDGPVLIVGFVLAALGSLAPFQPDGSVVFVEEPDVVRKRDVRVTVAGSPLVRAVVEWEYQRPGAADEFVNAHPGLAPSAVVPLVEYATPFAARLAERYGLPGAGLGAAEALRDKEILRRVTRAAGIANPASRAVSGPDEVRAFLAEHPGRAVLKPANRQASVGTRVLAGPGEVDAAWAECVVQDEGVFVPDRPMPLRMLVERYVAGPEYSVELLVRDGEPVFANVTGKSLMPGPRPVELAHVVPADLPDGQAAALRERTVAVLRAVGFATGIVHCEWIVSGGVPYLVECAGRFAGDGIVELIERAYRFGLVRAYYALLSGRPLPQPPPVRARKAAAVRFLGAEPGIVDSVAGVDEAASAPGVVGCSVDVAPGDPVPELRSSWDRVGEVMVEADTPGEAAELARAAMARVQVKVRPGLGSART
jgi:biotin carboxylase